MTPSKLDKIHTHIHPHQPRYNPKVLHICWWLWCPATTSGRPSGHPGACCLHTRTTSRWWGCDGLLVLLYSFYQNPNPDVRRGDRGATQGVQPPLEVVVQS